MIELRSEKDMESLCKWMDAYRVLIGDLDSEVTVKENIAICIHTERA